MGTIIQELQRILKSQKAKGLGCAWISPENLRAFYAMAPASAKSLLHGQQANAPLNTVKTPAPRPQVMTRPQQAMTMPTQRAPLAQPPAPRPFQPAAPRRAYAPHPQQTPPRLFQAQPMPDVSQLSWEQLTATAMNCHACQLCSGRQHVVFGEGCTSARLMFIGEGPGADEDMQGRPFVGRAGQMLTRMIIAMGLDRNAPTPDRGVYIGNIVKCRPPQNRNPEVEEGTTCLPLLKRQIQLVQPEVIVLLGAVPLRFLLGKTGITRLRGQWLDYQGIPVMPTFHPAYLLRFERQRVKFIEEKRKVWSDLQEVMAKLGLHRPQ